MNERTKELIIAAAQVLASIPDAVSITHVNGRYTIDAAPCDLGAIMGRQRKHTNAIEYLAQQIEPAAMIHVATSDAARPAHYPDDCRKDWTSHDETRLRAKIEHILKFIYPEAHVKHCPAVRESHYIVPGKNILADVVGSLHVLFRAWGRRNGRNVTITLPDESSAT